MSENVPQQTKVKTSKSKQMSAKEKEKSAVIQSESKNNKNVLTESMEKEEEEPLFPSAAPGKRPDYGTNNTLELLERIPNQIVNMKLDEVLTAVKTVDNLCDYTGCKTKTSLMGQDCAHCNKRYCFKHRLPEVHGCGEAVKKDERSKFMHPKPLKTVRQEEDVAKAKKRLHSKLKDMQVQRLPKSGGNSDGKKGKNNAAANKR